MNKKSRLLVNLAGIGILIFSTSSFATPCFDIITSDPNETPILSVCSDQSITILHPGAITSAGSGIVTTGSNVTITNGGTIETNGNDRNSIASSGNFTFINNSGTIINTGINGYGINFSGVSNTIINSGSIILTGDAAPGYISVGLNMSGDNATVINNGLISVSGLNNVGISSGSDDATITNSGTIRATGQAYAAIFMYGNVANNTVNLNRGSIIVGEILAHNLATGARLNINLGSGASYAYSVTGPWTVTDLDNRPMVTGSAYAAGIGAQETASEMLYQRTSPITSSLDRRLRSYAADEVDNQPYWLDIYYSDVSRNSGGNYSTQTAFSNHNYGITAGFKLPNEITPLELIVNVAQSNLNIDSGNQKIDSTSLMTGLLAPNLADLLGAKLSAKAMVGYADHDGDRKVMTNSLLYDGSRQIKSDYNSYYGVLGAALTKIHPITDHLNADVLVGLDLNTQRVESYKETDYFAWDGRTLTQLQSRVQAGLDYRFNENKASVFARVGAENRNLIGGATQDYEINNTNVSFNTNNKNDTYLTAQLGFRAQLEKRVSVFGVVSTLHSADSVNTVQGNIGLRADF